MQSPERCSGSYDDSKRTVLGRRWHERHMEVWVGQVEQFTEKRLLHLLSKGLVRVSLRLDRSSLRLYFCCAVKRGSCLNLRVGECEALLRTGDNR